MIPWQRAEGIYTTTKFGSFLMRLGFPFKAKFITKDAVKKMTGLSDDIFESNWEALKENGVVKEALVKYDDEGRITTFFEDSFNSLGG